MWGREEEEEEEEKLFDSNSASSSCFELIDLHLLLMRLDSKYKKNWWKKNIFLQNVLKYLTLIFVKCYPLSFVHLTAFIFLFESNLKAWHEVVIEKE